MKSNTEIFGRSLFGIQDGIDCGKVVELIINIEKKCAQYIILDKGRGVCGYEVLPLAKVSGIGKDIITTLKSKECKLLWENEEALLLGMTSVNLPGTPVFSNKGNIVGNILEFFINEKTGVIEKLVLDNGAQVDAESILTITKDKVFTFDGDLTAEEEPEPISEPAPEPPRADPVAEEEEEDENNAPRIDIPVAAEPEAAQISIEVEKSEEPDNKPEPEPAPVAYPVRSGGDGHFHDQSQSRLEHIIGCEIIRDVRYKSGAILAREGDIVTEELIRKVKDAGKGKLIELIQNVRK